MLTRTQLADILEAMEAARDLLDGQIDVVDGSYGEPAPNRAMTVCNQLDEAMNAVEREFDAMPVEPFPANAAAMGT